MLKCEYDVGAVQCSVKSKTECVEDASHIKYAHIIWLVHSALSDTNRVSGENNEKSGHEINYTCKC